MLNVKTNLIPNTIGGIAIGMMAAHWNDARTFEAPCPMEKEKGSIVYGGSQSTFGQIAITRITLLAEGTASLVSFYSNLRANQEELGSDFEKILFDNVWDLYAR
jgi:hypothetical protein